MAKAKKRAGKNKPAVKKKSARRKPAAKSKAATRKSAPAIARQVIIPGAWPFPMPAKT